MESIKFNFDQIPEKEARVLGQTLLEACKKFYLDPKNLAEYKAWEVLCHDGSGHSHHARR